MDFFRVPALPGDILFPREVRIAHGHPSPCFFKGVQILQLVYHQCLTISQMFIYCPYSYSRQPLRMTHFPLFGAKYSFRYFNNTVVLLCDRSTCINFFQSSDIYKTRAKIFKTDSINNANDTIIPTGIVFSFWPKKALPKQIPGTRTAGTRVQWRVKRIHPVPTVLPVPGTLSSYRLPVAQSRQSRAIVGAQSKLLFYYKMKKLPIILLGKGVCGLPPVL